MNETLTTVYSESMTDIPHGYYPRPQLVRSSFISLNGVWDFAISPSREEFGYKEKITVPFPPESALSGICRKIGKQDYMHYRRRFTLPDGFMRGRLILHFGAVDQICSVYVNGTLAVEHEGGYIPFSADITALVKDGENEITVCALDQLTHLYPYGKQTRKRGGMWYTPVSGIWQSVWLESVPKSYIHELRITADMTSATVCTTGGDEKKTLRLESGEIYEYVGNEITLTPSEPILWSPENPYLYYFTLECGEDKIESYFALRKIGVAVFDGISRLTLNGEPYLFNGLLDQGYYPDGLFMPASADAWRDDIALAKRLGFNMLRKHIKIEPMMFYHLCDTMGIVVFQDMVNNSDYLFLRDTALPTLGLQCISDKEMNSTQCTRDVFLTTMADTAALLYSTPSVLYYTIFNEGWGQFDADSVYDRLRAIDGTRIIDATSGWFRQKKSDVDSRHIYFKPLIVKKRDHRPLVISEFGGYSHRVKGHLFSKGNYGYRSFKRQRDFERAFFALYDGEARKIVAAGASALVYTQLSDVEDETNGLVTYDRRVVKVDEAASRALMESLKLN